MPPLWKSHKIRLKSTSAVVLALLFTVYFSLRTGAPPSVTSGMVLVPAGPFEMGAEDRPSEDLPMPGWAEENATPKHRVFLSAFYIDRFETTFGEFRRIYSSFTRFQGPEDQPVTNVTWYEADAYCHAIGKRLPSEEEWEKAARGTDGRLYPWGNQFDRSKANLDPFPLPVGSRKADRSPYGVMDMAGNVSEWTDSWYRPYPESHYGSAEFGLTHKVVRGGSFMEQRHYGDEMFARVTFRAGYRPEETGPDAGFRCALSAGGSAGK